MGSAAAALGGWRLWPGHGISEKKVGLGRVGSRKALIMLDLSHRPLSTQKSRGRHTCKQLGYYYGGCTVEGGTTSPRAGLAGLHRVS